MDISLRRAILEDLDSLEVLECACFSPSRRNNRRSLRLSLQSASQEVWVADVEHSGNNYQAGCLILYLYRKTLRIYSIAVLPLFQGKGIGRKLLQHVFTIARAHGIAHVSLEADAADGRLIQWYEEFGFVPHERLPDYYGPGEDALRLHTDIPPSQAISHPAGRRIHNLIVVDNPRRWKLPIDSAEVISARDYISSPRFQNMLNVRVFNMCHSYRYQSLGYYVSLLASARDHQALPNITTIRDFKHLSIVRFIAEDIDELLQESLKDEQEDSCTLDIYFSQAKKGNLARLAKELYHLFESPLLRIQFARTERWGIRSIKPLSLRSLPEEDMHYIQTVAQKYFQQKRFHRKHLKHYKYDLALLVNKDEATPPSCAEALQLFRQAAEKTGFYPELITKRDYDRICEFDALFIRETTDVNNHTYQFSRRAYAEGLVVMDDPWSILRCSNKMYINERMRQARILTPQTLTLCRGRPIEEQVHSLPFPLVLKRPDSCFSKGISKVDTHEDLVRELEGLFCHSDLVVAQEFVSSPFDWRIGVLDQCPLFACRYFMANNHWQIYNWNCPSSEAAGESETLPLNQVPPHVLSTAVRAASFVGDGLYGVDLKDVDGKAYLIEINDNPNIDKGIEDAVLKDELYLKIMQSLFNRIEIVRNTPRYVSFCGE